MSRKIAVYAAIAAGAVVMVGFGALATALSYVKSAGNRSRWGVQVVEKTGLEKYLIRRGQQRTREND